MDTNYQRVMPRDLFNEAKLLKCIGRLVLLIHDNAAPQGLSFEHIGDYFEIGLNDEGTLQIGNIAFNYKNVAIQFKTQQNSKSNYPLFAEYHLTDYLVFDDNGNFDTEFIELLNEISNATE